MPRKWQHFHAVLLVEMHEHLGVALRGEAMAAPLQFRAQFDVVVNFAIEDDVNGLILVTDGLPAAGNVHDAQPAHGQANTRRPKKALIIRTAMKDRTIEVLQQDRPIISVGRRHVSSDAAHTVPVTAAGHGLLAGPRRRAKNLFQPPSRKAGR
jgi:hypothetical protein